MLICLTPKSETRWPLTFLFRIMTWSPECNSPSAECVHGTTLQLCCTFERVLLKGSVWPVLLALQSLFLKLLTVTYLMVSSSKSSFQFPILVLWPQDQPPCNCWVVYCIFIISNFKMYSDQLNPVQFNTQNRKRNFTYIGQQTIDGQYADYYASPQLGSFGRAPTLRPLNSQKQVLPTEPKSNVPNQSYNQHHQQIAPIDPMMPSKAINIIAHGTSPRRQPAP